MDKLCAWLIRLSVQIRWFLVLRTAVSLITVNGDEVCGQSECLCVDSIILTSLFGRQLGETASEY